MASSKRMIYSDFRLESILLLIYSSGSTIQIYPLTVRDPRKKYINRQFFFGGGGLGCIIFGKVLLYRS